LAQPLRNHLLAGGQCFVAAPTEPLKDRAHAGLDDALRQGVVRHAGFGQSGLPAARDRPVRLLDAGQPQRPIRSSRASAHDHARHGPAHVARPALDDGGHHAALRQFIRRLLVGIGKLDQRIGLLRVADRPLGQRPPIGAQADGGGLEVREPRLRQPLPSVPQQIRPPQFIPQELIVLNEFSR